MTDGSALRVYFDTTLFIEASKGIPSKSDHILALLDFFETRPKCAVTSELTLAEVLGKETDLGWALQTRYFLNLIVWRKFIDLKPITRDILYDTAELRRALRQTGEKIKLPDAIHVSTAVKTSCRYLLSSDKRLKLPKSIQRLDPHEIGGEDFEKLFDA